MWIRRTISVSVRTLSSGSHSSPSAGMQYRAPQVAAVGQRDPEVGRDPAEAVTSAYVTRPV